MPPESMGSQWDFKDTYSFLSSTSTPKKASYTSAAPAPLADEAATSSLGNLNSLWDALNIPREGEVPALPSYIEQQKSAPTLGPFENLTRGTKDDKNAYASDGAVSYAPTSRNVRWADEVEDAGNLTAVQPGSPPSTSNLTKNQRKKRNRKARQEEAELREMAKNLRESKKVERAPKPGSPATVRAAHRPELLKEQLKGHIEKKQSVSAGDSKNPAGPRLSLSNGTEHNERGVQKPPVSHERKSSEHVVQEPPSTPVSKQAAQLIPTSVVKSGKPLSSPSPASPIKGGKGRTAGLDSNLKRTTSDAPAVMATQSHSVTPNKKPPLSPEKWPVASPAKPQSQSQQLENIISAAKRKAIAENPTQTPPQKAAAAALVKTVIPRGPKAYHQIRPQQDIAAVDRNWNLLIKIIGRFPESKKTMLSPTSLSFDKPDVNGIHVFIDASNILIGYHEHLKRARNIPEHVRIPLVHPSFAALALLLERRRPVAKRCLAGSTPHIDVYDEAAASGYELSILNKVLKARELTERQKRFAIRDAERRNGARSGGNSSGASTGGAAALPPQPERWVEQGVDEILHNKMGESLADTPPPAENAAQRPTAVLATGDAQQAEYSSGFGAWVLRLLKHGWDVEIVAWSANISHEYYRMERSRDWKGRFRIIPLDDFAEELFPPDDE